MKVPGYLVSDAGKGALGFNMVVGRAHCPG